MTDIVLELLIVVAVGIPVLMIFLSMLGVGLFDWLGRYMAEGTETQSEAASTETAPLNEALLAEEEI